MGWQAQGSPYRARGPHEVTSTNMVGEGGAEGSHNQAGRVLVVDDEESQLVTVSALLRRGGFEVQVHRRGAAVVKALEVGAGGVDAIFTDLHMPEMGGLALLEQVRASWPDIPVVMMTSDGTVTAAVQAMRLGAYDYLTRPFLQNEEVALTASRAVERRRLLARTRALEQTLDAAARFDGVVSESAAMREVFSIIEAAAPTDATVLLLGESGTGKELVARALHARSRRRAGAFLPVNCSALTETLLESELFGHVKGAFSGATTNRTGLFEEASAGTLFLDEIGDITPRVQVSLLRVLQESEVKPVGSSSTRKVNTRVIAATNRDLLAATKARTFREDLYYRLNVVTLELPPLRERSEDVSLLAHHFVQRYAQRFDKPGRRLAPEAVDVLQGYRWPGNVRELENTIQRMVVLSQNEELTTREIPALIRAAAAAPRGGRTFGQPYAAAKDVAVAEFEREYLESVLVQSGGNLAEAARIAGLDKSNFRRIARRHQIDLSRYRE
jgi:DNA-binding NtrC family response regulator